MLTQTEIKVLCAERDIIPQKGKGQNFLIDKNIVKKIISSADIDPMDIVLEVGPGLGVLTGELVKVMGRLVAVELDQKIALFLQQEYQSFKNMEVISGDILKLDIGKIGLINLNYRLIANLPYNITANFLRLFLAQKIKPKEMILMVQREVAERIVARPGKMSLLSVMVQFYSQPKVLFKVSRNSFWPRPKVDSAVIRLDIKAKLPMADEELFFKVVKTGYSQKRKQLKNNLKGFFGLDIAEISQILADLGINDKIRAQDLSVEEWVKLAEHIKTREDV